MPVIVVVVGPAIIGKGVRQPLLGMPYDGIPHLVGIQARWLTGGPIHSVSRLPIFTKSVHKSVTLCCVFLLVVQLNKCVVMCGSVLQMEHSDDGCLSLSILFEYESRVGHLFVLRWTRVRRVAPESVVS